MIGSKIVNYRTAKSVAAQARAFADSVQDPRRCDKLWLQLRIQQTGCGFVNSSTTTSWPPETSAAVLEVINGRLRSLLAAAADLLEQRAEALRQLAEEEAREVLGEVGR